jgi:DNA-directed RNA polymerase subunit E'/Rpb7
MADNIFMRMLLTDKIKLEPAFLSKRYKDEVLRRLKLKLEGICSRHGFIKPNSIEIYKVCMGKVELVSLNGNVLFDVSFYADICNPLIGSVIKSKVMNVNKFGILAEAEGVVEIIIAKNSVGIQSEVDLNKIRIGDEVLVEVVGKKFELNDKKIALIGRVVKDVKNVGQSSGVHSDEEDDEELQEGGEEAEAEAEAEDDEEKVETDDSDNDDEESVSEGGSVYDKEDNDTNSVLSGGGLEEELDGNFFSDEEDVMDGGDEEEVEGDDLDDTQSIISDEDN